LPQGTTRKQAERALAKLIADVERQARTEGNKTLGALHAEWEEWRFPSLSPTTRTGYRVAWARVPESLRKTRLDRLGPRDLDALYTALLASGLSVQSVRNTHTVISAVLTAGERWGFVNAPHAAVRSQPPAAPTVTSPRAPTTDEVAALLGAENDADCAVFWRVAAATGARRSEIGAMQWDDLNLDDGMWTVRHALAPDSDSNRLLLKSPKAHRAEGVIALDPRTTRMLREHRSRIIERALACGAAVDAMAFVFAATADGSEPVHPDYWSYRWRKLCRRANLKVRLHDLRHYVGTELADRGLPMPAVNAILGHSRLTTTQRYAGARRAQTTAAASAMAAALPE
jgi:integrase